VSGRDDVEEFAALLRRLKDRTDRSYGSLARRLDVNTSTLHRYCAGETVPQDFAPVERLAAFCEATPEERLELHRLWLSAVAARQRVRTAGSAAAVPAADTDGALVEESSSLQQPGNDPGPDDPAPARWTAPTSNAPSPPCTSPAASPPRIRRCCWSTRRHSLSNACSRWGSALSIVRRDQNVVPEGTDGYLRKTC
jgi:hypothetical protein